MSDLKVGDVVVRSKGGGIKSTIIDIKEDMICACRHFNNSRYWDHKDYWKLSNDT